MKFVTMKAFNQSGQSKLKWALSLGVLAAFSWAHNPAFAQTMTFVKDFWNIPEFGELLRVSQDELSQYVLNGEGTAQEALDSIAEQHTQILTDAGYIQP